MKSIKSIKKEVKKELLAAEQEALKIEIQKCENIEKALESSEKDFKKEKLVVQNMAPEALALWLIEKHTSYVEALKITLQSDFLNERDPTNRYYILIYASELYVLLTSFELDFFPKEVTDILEKENQVELLTILNVLNYI
jgi:hypothetical protein